MAAGDTYITFVKADYDGDQKQVSWATKPVTDYADYDTYIGDLVNLDAIVSAWCIGRDARSVASQLLSDNGGGSASSPVAQGNLRVILEGQDSVNGIVYKFPIPMPDLTKAADGGGDPAWIKVGQGNESLTVMNPAHADYDILKTRFQANALSPNGNPVLLVRGYVEE